jgi:uncharacterized membrane protein (UPF0136 family)
MPQLTLLFGVLLTALGLWGYFPDKPSVTALIPAFFGVPLALTGLWAGRPGSRKAAMHVAVLLTLLGAIGAGMQWKKKDFAFDAKGAQAQGLMTVLCALHLGLSVRSFIAARKGE